MVEKPGRELKIDHIYQNAKDKSQAIHELKNQRDVRVFLMKKVCYHFLFNRR